MKLRDVPLHRYQKFAILDNPTNDDLLKCFLGISQKELNGMPYDTAENYLKDIENQLAEEHKLVRTFKLNGEHYGFIPNLDEITYGENVDVTKYIGEYGSMHKAMAVLYRPIKQKINDKYLIEDYEGTYSRAEKMKDMPLSVALGAIVFFYNLTNELLNYTLNYLEIQVKMEKESQEQIISQENGKDILNSIHSLKEILLGLRKLPN